MIGFKLASILIVTILAVTSGSMVVVQNMTDSKANTVTVEVSPSPSPTSEPSVAPSPSPSPSATPSPSVKPSVKPSPSVVPSVSPSPTVMITTTTTIVTTTLSQSPKLNSLDPANPAFSTPMTIRGEGFGSQTGIINVYNSKGEPQPYPNSTSWNDTEIKTYSPFYASDQEYQIEVQATDGRRSNRLTVKSGAGQPHVDEISPSGAKPGDEITLKGGRFEGQGQVNFFLNYPNVSGSGTVVSWSDSEIKIKLPANLEAGKEYGVQVINGRGGQSSFKYYTLGN